MNAKQAIVVAVAAALGVWVAIAAAQGGLGAGGTGTGTTGFRCHYPSGATTYGGPCRRPSGFGGHPGGASGGAGGPHKHGGTANPGEREGAHGRRPHPGRLTFTFVVRLRDGASGISVSSYSAHVAPPHHAPASCQARVLRISLRGKKRQLARVRVRPPRGGWCHGRYRVTVSLKH